MYLASLYVSFDLDPSIPGADKDRLLLSLREKLKQKFKNKLTIRMNKEENGLAIAFFEQNYDKLKANFVSILDQIESCSEARIGFSQEQIFTWYQGQFIDSQDLNAFAPKKEVATSSSHRGFTAAGELREKTIIYSDRDDDDAMPIPSRFDRRNVRIPTRK